MINTNPGREKYTCIKILMLQLSAAYINLKEPNHQEWTEMYTK